MAEVLSDLVLAVVDCEHKTIPAGDGYALSVGTRAMKDGRLVAEACKPVDQESYEGWTRRMTPEPGDLILAREAPVGQVVRVPETTRVCLGQRTVLIRPDPKKIEPRFLHYWLLGPAAQNLMGSQAAGATVPHLNVGDIRKLDVSGIPLDRRQQEFAASALGAIDDLIENNRRRVEVLEEMARAMYREWFVHFRFPGHEDATFVDSELGPIPEGWKVRNLDSVASVVRGRSYRKAELVEPGDGLPFLNLKCMQRGGGFRRDGLKWYDGKFKEAQLAGRGDIVLAVTDLTQGREILARATLVPRLPREQGVISLDVAKIVPDVESDRLWTFGVLRWSDFSDRVKEYANGSTVLHLSPTHVANALLLWPPSEMRRRLAETIGPMMELTDELSDVADRAAGIRDLLLPKLVTGQIDVSDLDLDALVEEASV